MGKNRFQKYIATFIAKRQERKAEKHLTAALTAQVQQIARDSQAGFRMAPGYSKKLIQPARIADAYIEKQLALIPGPVVLDPERWQTDHYLNALFANADAIRDLIRTSKRLRTFFAEENADQVNAVMTADWKQKTIMGVESEGEMVRRDVPQSVYYFDNHEILEVHGTLTDTHKQLRHRILGALLMKVITDIQGLQEWSDNLKKERDVLDLFIQHSGITNSAIETDGSETRVNEARQVLAQLEKKEQDLQDQIGDAESQLSQVAAALLNPHPQFNIDAVDLMLNRQGLLMKRSAGKSGPGITLSKCSLVDRPSKVIVWVQVNP